MKQYNKTISIEVSVDTLAQRLTSALNPTTPNVEGIVDAIIGPHLANSSSKLVYLYNALAGYSNDITFKVGDQVTCSEDMSMFDSTTGKHKWEKTNQVMTITKINIYASDSVEVEYNNNREISHYWVSHSKLKVAPRLVSLDSLDEEMARTEGLLNALENSTNSER